MKRTLLKMALLTMLTATLYCRQAYSANDRMGDPLPQGAVQRLGTLRLRFGWIGDLAYLPDGNAIIGSGSTIEMWDFRTGVRLFGGAVVEDTIRSLDVHPDGRAVLITDTSNAASEWDPVTKTITRRIRTGQSNLASASYAPGGTRILTVGATPPTLKEFILADGTERIAIQGETHNFSHAVYDAAGATAFAGGSAGSGPVLVHYDLTTGSLLHAWHKDFTSYNRSPLLSPDGERVLAGTRHMAIEFLIDGYKELNRFRGHHGHAVTSIAYCHEPEHILTGSRDGSIRRWDRVRNEVLGRWVAHSGHCTRLRISPDGRRVLSFGGGMVVESDIDTGTPTLTWERHTQSVEAVVMLPDGKRAVSGSADQTLRVWDIATGKSLMTIAGATLGAYALAAAPDGKRVAVGCKDGVVREFGLADGKLLRELPGHLGYVRSVAYTPDGQRLLSSADDGRIRVWQTDAEEAVQILRKHLGGVLCIAICQDGRRLLSSGRDGTVRLWDLERGELLHTLTGHRGWVETVCFGQEQNSAFSAGRDGRILKWDLDTGQVNAEWVHGGWVRSLASAADGSVLCAGGEDNRITCWELPGGTLVNNFDGHAARVLGLALTKDGKHLISASADTTLLVWALTDD